MAANSDDSRRNLEEKGEASSKGKEVIEISDDQDEEMEEFAGEEDTNTSGHWEDWAKREGEASPKGKEVVVESFEDEEELEEEKEEEEARNTFVDREGWSKREGEASSKGKEVVKSSEEDEEMEEEEENEEEEEMEEEEEEEKDEEEAMSTFVDKEDWFKKEGEASSKGKKVVKSFEEDEEIDEEEKEEKDEEEAMSSFDDKEGWFKKEEEAGRLKFMCVTSNAADDEHLIWLIGLKNIYAKQPPRVAKKHLLRVVMDRYHKSMIIIRCNKVIGGITYRPFISQKFGEILACAVAPEEQFKGYGTRMMNHLKQHVCDIDGLTHLLTYAISNAVGFFRKQGFSEKIELEKDIWKGYIKHYGGRRLMECIIYPGLPYADQSTLIQRQKLAIFDIIQGLPGNVYPGINIEKTETGIPIQPINIEDIPGIREAGWTSDQWGYSQYTTQNASVDRAAYQQSLNAFMHGILKMLINHPDSWPFLEPVDVNDAPNYYEIIKDPIDLSMISERLESNRYYVTIDMFVADIKRMLANARTFNSPDTVYFHCAARLEKSFWNKFHFDLRNLNKFLQ